MLVFLLYSSVVQAQARKAALRKIPEQTVLQEVRRMVEDMQALNKRLEETEAAIEEYFKPIDKEAETIMKIQLDGEEKTMKQMMATMQREAFLEKMEAEKMANICQQDVNQSNQDATTLSSSQHAQMR
ncbi:uncharacterized protein LOC120155084 isoform X2 [Hibiscus syriacus]|uniref:uncharacterized protein LOC120155084 isoform X2 n=1 Tax=Hibiscus syriacus TaxID=106335 RepID=UPI0019226726|nr:uncharacterized protein LOC120155084 isoform X2 [Hibiscus syriacus]